MKPHVTLVNPAAPPGAFTHLPFALLGLGYLAAVLEKNQYPVDVIDCQVVKLSFEEFQTEIGKRQPDIVGVTSSTLTYRTGLKLVKIAKKVNPNCLTVMGGPHVTFWDDKALEECPELDVVVRKEGENTFLELVQRIEAGKSTHDVIGTTCRKDGKIVRNPDRPYIEDLDTLPFPARHLWPMERLREYEDILYLATSRGCVYWCEFCSTVRMHGRKYRMRSPKNVVDELEYLHKTFNVDKFTFCDDAFTVDQPRIEELCREILNRGLKIKWNCGTRVDMITKDLLMKMKEAGCISVWFGVESASQEVLDCMKKGISTEQTIKALGWVRELGLKPVPNVILGFPGETKESAWKTIKFVEKISPDDVGFYNVATPFPGTPMYDSVKEKGWLRVTDFDKYDTTTPIFETPWLSMEDLGKLREAAFHHFYLRPGYFLHNYRKRKFWTLATALTILSHLKGSIKLKLR
ncbi:MAG: B12-binding domain-containing radical SAM protein [Candidatus Bathyarchaeota archaeon]|nr:B12-binding domain-containing radical SAM protein [Candidatus Bathyarchaeota archaeon]